MIFVHAIWNQGRLHLWAEHAQPPDSANSEGPALSAVDAGELPTLVGDRWDSLLVGDAEPATVSLRLPHDRGIPLAACADLSRLAAPTLAKVDLPCLAFSPADAMDLLSRVPDGERGQLHAADSLRFWAKAARLVLELLAFQRVVPDVHRGHGDVYRGFWRVVITDESTSARLGKLIAGMPPVCRAVAGENGQDRQASVLVENFLWTTVDALVRRTMEGDELVHALFDELHDRGGPEITWLRSLVRDDAILSGSPETVDDVWRSVKTWLDRLSPPAKVRTCRTCFLLSPPPVVNPAMIEEDLNRDWDDESFASLASKITSLDEASTSADELARAARDLQDGAAAEDRVAGSNVREDARALRRPVAAPSEAASTSPSKASAANGQPLRGEPRWQLTFHVEAISNPEWVVSAERLWYDHQNDPLVLRRPFEGAGDQLREDLAVAARVFPPLEACVQEDHPVGCELTLEQAYQFLRDAMPLLEAEGFPVWVPRWWRGSRPRLGMRLHLQGKSELPEEHGGGLSLDTLVDYDWKIALGEQDLSLEEISELAHAKAPLVRLRGRWVEAQPSDVRAALRFLQQERSGQMTVFEALRQSFLNDDLQTGLPVIGLEASGWIDRLLNASNVEERMEDLQQPAEFHGELRPYQLKGLAWLRFLARHGLGACLADDMGLGKTIQLIAMLLEERSGGANPGPTLLVLPMSLVGNWQREIERFAPKLTFMVHHGLDRLSGEEFVSGAERVDVVISTYGLIHRDHEHLARVQWHRVALDEAQNIKNPAAKQSAAVRKLLTVHRVGLTGTPVENRLSELWSIMDFLNPGYLGSATDFRRRFAVPIERHQDRDKASRLRQLIRPFVLRRVKSDPDIAAELPDKMEMKTFCNLTKEQASLYEAVVGNMINQIGSSQGITRRGLILAALVKLKQICNHPALFLKDGGSLQRRSGKCDRLTEMLEEVVAEGDCALVFTQFRQMGDLLKKLLEDHLNCEVLFLNGGTEQKKRVAMVERFQDPSADTPVFILSLKAGGFGLNLTAARHVFHFDRWWNPAVENQATDRAHRIGQSKQVQVHKYVCIGTLEERIDAMITRKQKLAEKIVGSGEDWLTELSTEALRELFSLSHDAVADE